MSQTAAAAGFRVPSVAQRLWNWLISVPEGVSIDWRAWYAGARVRLTFAITFGFVYWHFYFTKRTDPFYSAEGLHTFIRLDVPLRSAWIVVSALTLIARSPRALKILGIAVIFIELGAAANIVVHTGALSSSFLFFYAIYPMVIRLGYTRTEAYIAAAVSIIAAVGGASLTILNLYPEAAFYSELSRATFDNPQVSFIAVGNVLGGLLSGVFLAEWARRILELREEELRQANASLKEAIDEIGRKQRQLVETGALAAIGEFVRGAAHEIGNPLGSAHSLVTGVREDLAASPAEPLPPDLKEELAATLGMAITGQERVRSIVTVLHALSIHTEVKASRFDLAHALKLAMDTKGPGTASVALEGTVPEVHLYGNCDQLGDALGRIVQNGREFAKHSLKVSCRHDPTAKRVWIVFEDDGPGFTPDGLKSAVEPFFTTRKADKAHLGLGLFIARVVTGRMGGILTVENASEGGGRVTVELPVE